MVIAFFAAAGAVSAVLPTARPVPAGGQTVLHRDVPAEAAVPVTVTNPSQV
jgi:hypothetical protein